MSTAVEPDIKSIADFECTLPCKRKGCDEPAAAMIWAKHKKPKCGSTIMLCQGHLEDFTRRMVQFLSEPGNFCSQCWERIEGTLEDNMRVIPL